MATKLTAKALIADITDLVESVDGTVVCETRPAATEATHRVPYVHARLTSGAEFKVSRPTFRAARAELIDWLKLVAV